MSELNLRLHPGQLEVFNDPARFKVVCAGRRWGKSRLAAVTLLTEALKDEKNGRSLKNVEVWYIAPTLEMCRDIMWRTLKGLAEPVIRKTWENELKIELANGRLIQLKSADNPDRLRGVALSYVVFDEYAWQKPEAWEYIIRPTLADVEGGALFVGTPLRRNHYYELFLRAQMQEDWSAKTYVTTDNPFIAEKEVALAKESMSIEAFRQEFEASFDTFGATILDPNLMEEAAEPEDGDVYVAVDLAGFRDEKTIQQSKLVHHDETAIASVKVSRDGWYVLDIDHGRWDVRESSIRILRAVQDHRPLLVGIEAGALKNAISPYLEDQRRRLGIPCQITEVRHGGKSKSQRIAWALQGRLQHGRIKFAPGDYLRELRSQAFDYPGGRRDDLLDALSYIDQLATTVYRGPSTTDSWEPLDAVTGY